MDALSLDGALAAGSMVGAYRIERRLGAGGVGTVYAAVEPSIHKRVAIKVLKRAFADDPAAVERFRREAQAANGVRHPGIVDVFAIGTLADGRPYLVMSLLEGRSLREELTARGRIAAGEAWAIARDVAEAVGAAHAAGVVHRDLKPDNVFLERFGAAARARVRVLDFGLAKVLAPEGEGAAAAKITQTGVMVGTPAYMAPEQWFNAGVGPATDQYALGAMLYEMIAGTPPFVAEQFARLMQEHLSAEVPALLRGGGAVDALVRRALAKEAAKRFASMEELVRAGDAAFAGEDAAAVTVAAAVSPAGAAAATAPLTDPHAATMQSGGAPRAQKGAGSTRFLVAHAAIFAAGWAALVGVGYVGPGRRNVLEWCHIAGWQGYLGFALLAAGATALAVLASRRARDVRSRAGWAFALLPALAGALGTYSGWMMALGAAAREPPAGRFAALSAGLYEANASRFMGFAYAAMLSLGLVALAGVSARSTATEQFRLGIGRRDSVAGIATLLALVAVAALAGAPSAALVAGTGALALAVGLALPAGDPARAAGDELERGVAGLVAVVFAASAAFARIQAREGLLWTGFCETRAARAAEIVAAAAERRATTVLALVALLVVAGVEAVRVARLRRAGALVRPRVRALLLAGLVAAAIAADAVAAVRIVAVREGYRDALADRFALLGRMDPPVASGVPPDRFVPGDAPALQLGRDVAAVNADPVARLTAADLEPLLRARLTEVLARAAAARATGAPGAPELVDLAVAVDRALPWALVQRLLHVAYDAGVRRVEILLARSPAPSLGAADPPEAAWPVPADFLALPATLAAGPGGFAPAADAPFGAVAATLAASGPVTLAIGP